MLYFQKMIDIMTKEGISISERKLKNDFTNMWKKLEGSHDLFFEKLNECQNFVFSQSGDTKDPDIMELGDRELSLPFPTISIEMLDGHITIPRPSDPIQIYIDCIFVHELEPNRYMILGLLNTNGKHEIVPIQDKSTLIIIENLLQRLKKENHGIEEVNKKIKIRMKRHGKNIKQNHTIRRIIHVCPGRKEYNSYGTRKVEWNAAWVTMGHWRRVNGIGKDRQGSYNQKGYTWVKEHIKGDKSKGIIKKLRFVK